MAGIRVGGAKAVIAVPPDLPIQSRSELLKRYGEIVNQLGGLFSTGPDLGTSAEDMDIIAERGAPYVYGRTPDAGGPGDSGPITAVGVFAGIQVTCEHLFGNDSLKDRQVVVQGAGSVGGPLIEQLLAAGAKVSFSEIDEALTRRFRDELSLKYIRPRDVYETDCDILAPCALGGVVNADTIPKLKCRAVVGAANNQLAQPEDAESLRARGIMYAPDYLVNMGGALALTQMEDEGWSQTEAERQVRERVRRRLQQVYDMAKTKGVTTEAAAREIVESELKSELDQSH
jgi:glutamate dehydrogenase/leucine dehydrogenase